MLTDWVDEGFNKKKANVEYNWLAFIASYLFYPTEF